MLEDWNNGMMGYKTRGKCLDGIFFTGKLN
jgi:hypothetical protein